MNIWNPNKQINDKDQFYILDNEGNIIESQPTIEKPPLPLRLSMTMKFAADAL